MREMVGGCCVCSDDRGWSENPLVYCDGQLCTVAVHQACYGIVTVPIGPWYCRKCESQERSVKVKCELCPSKYGALKRTDNSGWAHVVCALYIPEVRFGNVTTMEPIQLQLIPAERFNKVCYICEEKGKASSATVGACMQCNKSGCKQQFHVTCAQGLGLLCEEAGNYLDNVKYCGYCQHHYSKLKKWGNVKTIPPYKPISTENHLSDSNSEKELESGPSSTTPSGGSTTTGITTTKPSSTSPATGKRKSSSGSKSSSSKSSSSSSAPSGSKSSSSNSSSQQKTVHSNSKSSDKSKVINSNSSKSAKSDESNTSVVSGQPPPVIVTETVLPDITKRDTKSDTVESVEHNKVESGKEGTSNSKSSSKKRKVNSRTPTPVSSVSSAIVSDISVVVNSTISGLGSSSGSDKKISDLPSEKPKKPKIETTQSILTNQPVVALTSISTIKASSPVTTVADIATTSDTAHSALPTQSIIQTQPVNSLLVSVPLTSTSLSPHHPSILNNQTSVLTPNTILQEHNSSVERTTPINTGLMTGGNSNSGPAGMLTSEMSGGGLKITYEKQDSINTEVDMELEVSPQPQDIPAKRGRSQSHDKTDRSSRGKKRSSGANGINAQLTSSSSNPGLASKRSSRSHHSTPPPIQQQPSGAFSSITQAQLKDSPPSSPSSESQGAPPTNRSSRSKSRKSAPAAVNMSSSSKDTKDIKLFQNGVAAPHMLGNQLNPNSNMAQKMNDHLNSELEAHSIFNPNDNNSNLIGPQLHHRVVQSARASSAGGSSTASGGSGLSSMIGGGGGNIPQTLDQLLERQWEQGSQFLMEQAQHFDIASLLSCLHQLRAENLRLEEDVASLLQRRDHLLAVNARLAIPLTGQPATPQSGHPHTVNNIHPSLPVPHGDLPRPPRHTSGSYSSHSTAGPVENGLPPDQAYMQHSHRSPSGSQSSPTVRHSSSGSGYGSSGQLQRQNADTSGRSAPRPQPYPLYQGPGSSSQAQQQVIRRDSDLHHQNSSKPS